MYWGELQFLIWPGFWHFQTKRVLGAVIAKQVLPEHFTTLTPVT
jgi:hypothetical protein